MCVSSCVCMRSAPLGVPSQSKVPTTSPGCAVYTLPSSVGPVTDETPFCSVTVYGSLFFSVSSTLSPASLFSSPNISFLCLSIAPHLPPLPRCVFLPDNGAFFVNYVITAALLGTGMELMRLGSLCMYCTRLFFSRSEPERVHIRKVRASPSVNVVLSFSWEGKKGV